MYKRVINFALTSKEDLEQRKQIEELSGHRFSNYTTTPDFPRQQSAIPLRVYAAVHQAIEILNHRDNNNTQNNNQKNSNKNGKGIISSNSNKSGKLLAGGNNTDHVKTPGRNQVSDDDEDENDTKNESEVSLLKSIQSGSFMQRRRKSSFYNHQNSNRARRGSGSNSNSFNNSGTDATNIIPSIEDNNTNNNHNNSNNNSRKSRSASFHTNHSVVVASAEDDHDENIDADNDQILLQQRIKDQEKREKHHHHHNSHQHSHNHVASPLRSSDLPVGGVFASTGAVSTTSANKNNNRNANRRSSISTTPNFGQELFDAHHHGANHFHQVHQVEDEDEDGGEGRNLAVDVELLTTDQEEEYYRHHHRQPKSLRRRSDVEEQDQQSQELSSHATTTNRVSFRDHQTTSDEPMIVDVLGHDHHQDDDNNNYNNTNPKMMGDDTGADDDDDDEEESSSESEDDDVEMRAQIDAEELLEQRFLRNLELLTKALNRRQIRENQRNSNILKNNNTGEGSDDNNNNDTTPVSATSILQQSSLEVTPGISSLNKSIWERMFTEPRNASCIRYTSLFILPPHMPLRVVTLNLTKTRIFEGIVQFFIVLNCVLLAVEDQSLFGDRSAELYEIFDNVFVAVFSLEMVLKIVALGFVGHRGSYLRDPWNNLDFLIMVLTYLNYVSGSGNFTALRSLRVLRPLRSLNAIPGLKILVRSFLASLRAMGPVALLSLMVIYIFAIVGVQLFSGLFHFSCVHDFTGEIEFSLPCRNGTTSDIESGEYWGFGCPSNYTCQFVENPYHGYYGFDNIFQSLLVIFSFSTFDGWTVALERGMGSVGVITFFFFAFCVMCVGILIPNLLLAVINLEYSREQERDRINRENYARRVRQILSQKLNALALRIDSTRTREMSAASSSREQNSINNINNTNHSSSLRTNDGLSPSSSSLQSPTKKMNSNNHNLLLAAATAGADSAATRRLLASSRKQQVQKMQQQQEKSPQSPSSSSVNTSNQAGPLSTTLSKTDDDDEKSNVSTTNQNDKNPLLFDSARDTSNERPEEEAVIEEDLNNNNNVHSDEDPNNNSSSLRANSVTSGVSSVNAASKLFMKDVEQQEQNHSTSDKTLSNGKNISGELVTFSPTSSSTLMSPTSHNSRSTTKKQQQKQQQLPVEPSFSEKVAKCFNSCKKSFDFSPETWHTIDSYRDACHELTEGFPRSSDQAAAIHVSRSNTSLARSFSHDTNSEDRENGDDDALRSAMNIEDAGGEGEGAEFQSGRSGESSAQADTGQIRSTWFMNLIVVMIVLNTFLLASQHAEQPEWLDQTQRFGNAFFTAVFAIEMIMRLFSIGFKAYVKSPFDLLDGFIVVSSLIELIITSGSGTSTFSVFRALRLLRVMKLLKQFPSLRSVVRVALYAMGDASYLLFIVLLYIFVFSLLGQNLFNGNLIGRNRDPETEPQTRYDSFLESFYSSFQILSMDLWVSVMYDLMSETHPLAAIFFIIQIITGGFILISLFLSILVAAFRKLEMRVSQSMASKAEFNSDEAEKLREQHNQFKHNMLDATLVQRVYRFGTGQGRGNEFNKKDFTSASVGIGGLLKHNQQHKVSNQLSGAVAKEYQRAKAHKEEEKRRLAFELKRRESVSNILFHLKKRSSNHNSSQHHIYNYDNVNGNNNNRQQQQRRKRRNSNINKRDKKQQQPSTSINTNDKKPSEKSNSTKKQKKLREKERRRNLRKLSIGFDPNASSSGAHQLLGNDSSTSFPAEDQLLYDDSDPDDDDDDNDENNDESYNSDDDYYDSDDDEEYYDDDDGDYYYNNNNNNVEKLVHDDDEDDDDLIEEEDLDGIPNPFHEERDIVHLDNLRVREEEYDAFEQLAATPAKAIVHRHSHHNNVPGGGGGVAAAARTGRQRSNSNKRRTPTQLIKTPNNKSPNQSPPKSPLILMVSPTDDNDNNKKPVNLNASSNNNNFLNASSTTPVNNSLLKVTTTSNNNNNSNSFSANNNNVNMNSNNLNNSFGASNRSKPSSRASSNRSTASRLSLAVLDSRNEDAKHAINREKRGSLTVDNLQSHNNVTEEVAELERMDHGQENKTQAKNDEVSEWAAKASAALTRMKRNPTHIEQLGRDYHVPRYMFRHQFKEYTRARRANSANKFYATAPVRSVIDDISRRIPKILWNHGPDEEDKPPQPRLPICSLCGEELHQALPPAPLVAQPSPEILHSLKCGKIRVRRARTKLLKEMVEVLDFYISTNEPPVFRKIDNLLAQAEEVHSLMSVKAYHFENLEGNAAWEALREECLMEIKVLDLRVGEDELGKSLIAQAFACIPVQHQTNGGDALFIFDGQNKFRRLMSQVVEDTYFEAFILICVIISSALLALSNPLDDPESTKARVSFVGSFVFTIIFAVESVMKIIAYGFYFVPNAYLKDPWNVLDFVIAMTSLVSDTQSDVDLSYLKVFRTLRATRTLRVLRRAKGMKTVVFALVQNIKAIANVGLLCLIFLLIFAILAVQLYAGEFRHCTDPSINFARNCTGFWYDPNAENVFVGQNDSVPVVVYSNATESNTTVLRQVGNIVTSRFGAWVPREYVPDFQNFDSVPQALLTLFEITSAEGWMWVVWRATDTCDPNTSRSLTLDCNPAGGLFFVAFFAFSSFFLMQLFVSFIIYNYEKVNKTVSGSEFLTAEQRVWISTQQLVANFKPEITVGPREGSRFAKQLYDHAVNHLWFDIVIALCIVTDVIVLSMDYYGQSSDYAAGLETASVVVAFIFLVEAMCKLVCFGLRYFKSSENRFDFFLVVIGIFSWNVFGLNLRFLVVLRVIRLSRILRLLRFAKGIQILLETLVFSLPSIANMGSFIILITFSFGVLGVDTYATLYIPPNANVLNDRLTNFRQLDSALMLLFRFLTLEDWVGVMRDASIERPSCATDDSCGSALSPLYFCLYVVATSYIVLNLIMASMLVQFELTMALDESNPKMAILHRFVEQWSFYDPDATLLIPTMHVPRLLVKLGPPMGLLRAGSRVQILKKMGTFFIPEHLGKVHFMEVLLALEMGLSPPKEDDADRIKREFFVMMKDNFPELEELPVQRIGNGRMITADLHFAQTYLAAAERRRQAYRRAQNEIRRLAALGLKHRSLLMEDEEYFAISDARTKMLKERRRMSLLKRGIIEVEELDQEQEQETPSLPPSSFIGFPQQQQHQQQNENNAINDNKNEIRHIDDVDEDHDVHEEDLDENNKNDSNQTKQQQQQQQNNFGSMRRRPSVFGGGGIGRVNSVFGSFTSKNLNHNQQSVNNSTAATPKSGTSLHLQPKETVSRENSDLRSEQPQQQYNATRRRGSSFVKFVSDENRKSSASTTTSNQKETPTSANFHPPVAAAGTFGFESLGSRVSSRLGSRPGSRVAISQQANRVMTASKMKRNNDDNNTVNENQLNKLPGPVRRTSNGEVVSFGDSVTEADSPNMKNQPEEFPQREDTRVFHEEEENVEDEKTKKKNSTPEATSKSSRVTFSVVNATNKQQHQRTLSFKGAANVVRASYRFKNATPPATTDDNNKNAHDFDDDDDDEREDEVIVRPSTRSTEAGQLMMNQTFNSTLSTVVADMLDSRRRAVASAAATSTNSPTSTNNNNDDDDEQQHPSSLVLPSPAKSDLQEQTRSERGPVPPLAREIVTSDDDDQNTTPRLHGRRAGDNQKSSSFPLSPTQQPVSSQAVEGPPPSSRAEAVRRKIDRSSAGGSFISNSSTNSGGNTNNNSSSNNTPRSSYLTNTNNSSTTAVFIRPSPKHQPTSSSKNSTPRKPTSSFDPDQLTTSTSPRKEKTNTDKKDHNNENVSSITSPIATSNLLAREQSAASAFDAKGILSPRTPQSTKQEEKKSSTSTKTPTGEKTSTTKAGRDRSHLVSPRVGGGAAASSSSSSPSNKKIEEKKGSSPEKEPKKNENVVLSHDDDDDDDDEPTSPSTRQALNVVMMKARKMKIKSKSGGMKDN